MDLLSLAVVKLNKYAVLAAARREQGLHKHAVNPSMGAPPPHPCGGGFVPALLPPICHAIYIL